MEPRTFYDEAKSSHCHADLVFARIQTASCTEVNVHPDRLAGRYAPFI